MNFMNVLSKLKGIFFTVAFVMNSGSSFSMDNNIHNERTLIHRFTLPDFFKFHSINDISFDDKGVLYISSDYRLYTFNGSFWNYVSTQGKTYLTTTSDNQVYYIDGNDFGILSTDSSLSYRTYSQKALIPSEVSKDNDFRQLRSRNEDVYLNIDGTIYVLKDESLLKLNRFGEGSRLVGNGDKLLIISPEGVGYPIDNTNVPDFRPGLPSNALYRGTPDGYLVYEPRTKAFFTLSDNLDLKGSWKTEVPGTVRDFICDNKGHTFILTDDQSLYITGANGNVLSVNHETPFSRNSNISRFIYSPYGQVWLIQDHSIFQIDYPSSYFDTGFNTVQGSVEDFVVFKDTLYVATNRGLFSCGKQYRCLTHEPVIRLFPVRDELLALSEKKLYKIRDGKCSPIPVLPFRDAAVEPNSENLVLASDSGFRVIRKKDDYAGFKYFNTGKNASLFLPAGDNLYYIKDHILFILNTNTGLESRIDIPGERRKHTISELFWWNQKVHILSENTIMGLNEKTGRFTADVRENISGGAIQNILVINDHKIVIVEKNDLNDAELILFDARKNKASLIPVPFRLSAYSIRLKVANDSMIVCYDSDRIYMIHIRPQTVSKKYSAIITSIIAGDDTILSGTSYDLARALIREKLNHIPFKNNSLDLVFSTTDFMPGLKKFQYQINTTDTTWSAWLLGNILKLGDLKEGEYVLRTRFMNSQGVVSEPVQLRFTIRPPVYRTWYAYFAYILSTIILLFIGYKTYRFKLHRLYTENENLDREKLTETKFPSDIKPYEFISTIDPENKPKKTKWDKYEMATVLFSDIQGFTRIAEQMNPELLIDELDKFFFHFDSVVERYNIEKIKTIGDAYMAAGGIPKKNSTNPIEVVLAALEMQQFMKQLKRTNVDIWDLRIGIHSGPVIAGTIGQKKRSYDIWGDTVNTASRMESSGEGGKVNISATTYNLIKDYFICEYRGKLPVKYKGNIAMYFVKGLRPELSINLAGIPNRKFFLKLQLLRLTDLEEYTYDRLDVELSSTIYFHNANYARQTYSYAGLLCKAEDLDLEETLMIRTACLLLPLGYIISHENPEKEAAAIARDILPEYLYSEKQANLISNLILSTKRPPAPRNLLEEIMADTSMEYLGRVDYIKLYKLLFLEYNEFHERLEIRDWKDIQINVLKEHEYFTAGAKRLREVSGEEQIRKINEDNW